MFEYEQRTHSERTSEEPIAPSEELFAIIAVGYRVVIALPIWVRCRRYVREGLKHLDYKFATMFDYLVVGGVNYRRSTSRIRCRWCYSFRSSSTPSPPLSAISSESIHVRAGFGVAIVVRTALLVYAFLVIGKLRKETNELWQEIALSRVQRNDNDE